jgi:hypothetical protein
MVTIKGVVVHRRACVSMFASFERHGRIHDAVKVCRDGEDVNEDGIGPALSSFNYHQHSGDRLPSPRLIMDYLTGVS